jgi:serine/threonine protein kinase
MHRDLHPANVLLSLDNDVKLCDFNLCREEAAPESDLELTDYVTSRWYRAPELVMQWRHYTRAVDLWSAGCLLAELYRGSPLFRGSTFYQQLDAIVHVIGRPSAEEIDEIGSPAARKYLFMNPDFVNLRLKPLKDHVPNASPAALDLLSKLLQFVPSKRISVEEALRHPFFADLYNPDDIPPPHPAFEADRFIESLQTPLEIRNALEVEIAHTRAMEASRLAAQTRPPQPHPQAEQPGDVAMVER